LALIAQVSIRMGLLWPARLAPSANLCYEIERCSYGSIGIFDDRLPLSASQPRGAESCRAQLVFMYLNPWCLELLHDVTLWMLRCPAQN